MVQRWTQALDLALVLGSTIYKGYGLGQGT